MALKNTLRKKTYHKKKLHKKKTYKNKLHKKKTYKKKVTKKQTRKLKGGKLLGVGSYGSVYSDPRLLCDDENLENILRDNKDEVSKIFVTEEEAYKDSLILSNLTEYLGDDFNDFNKYAIIPYNVCNLKRGILDIPPYNTREWYGKVHPSQYDQSKISISKKGGYDLHTINKLISNPDVSEESAIKYIKNIINVGKGVEILIRNKLIHGDIKPQNIILDNNNFEGDILPYIIDVGDINKIENISDPLIFYAPAMYMFRPPTIVYTAIKGRYKNYVLNFINNKIVFKSSLLYEFMYNMNQKEFNLSTSRYTISQYLNSHLLSLLNDEHATFTFNLLYNVFAQKYYNAFNGKDYDDFSFSELIQTLREPRTDRNKIYINKTLQYFNTIFTSYNNESDITMNIFQRVDLYSFGITIYLGMIGFLNKKYKINSITGVGLTEDESNYITKLVIIIYMCCYITPTDTADMTPIIQKILTLYEKANNNEPFKRSDIVLEQQIFIGDELTTKIDLIDSSVFID